MTPDDLTLLQDFAVRQSEPAFAALVERYVGLVHSAALRQTGDAHLAEEITQAVFIVLARKAASLGKGTVLPAWLYRTTRYTASNALKIQRRRQAREQEAYMQSTLNEPDDAAAWKQIAPLLDDTMDQLSERDRAAVVLRYFENRPWREVADQMQMTEDAAEKRVGRALEKLRSLFHKRGVMLTASLIAGAVAANSVQAAPLTLTQTVTAVVISKGSVASASTLTLVKGTLQLMTWLKTKTVLMFCAGSVLAGATVLTIEQQEEQNRQQEQAIRAEEQQIRAREQQPGLASDQKQKLDGRLNDLRQRQNELRATQNELREQDTNPFAKPSNQISPFTRVRFEGDKVFVNYLNNEKELATVNGQSVADILDFCNKKYGGSTAQRRFAEDLVVVLADMGHPAGDDNTVSLTLVDAKTGAKEDVARALMTAENRKSVYRALHPKQ